MGLKSEKSQHFHKLEEDVYIWHIWDFYSTLAISAFAMAAGSTLLIYIVLLLNANISICMSVKFADSVSISSFISWNNHQSPLPSFPFLLMDFMNSS